MAWIITWNKDKWSEEKMQDLMDRFSSGEIVVERWKFGAHKKGCIGDRVYLSRTGKLSPGLMGSGKIASEPRQEEDFSDSSKNAWYVDICFDYLADKASKPVASHEYLADLLGVSSRAFTPEKSGTSYRGIDADLEKLWDKLTGNLEPSYAGEADFNEASEYIEGAKKTVLVNRYERDLKARQKCIDHHGIKCKACGIDLSLVYGLDLGKNYIHVHHIVPLSSIGKEYVVDPIEDLVPLCPNCHAMIHQVNPPMTVSSLRSKILARYLKLFK
ncbi:HNH endonuclease [Amphritea opalescens]|uniref:HNH endonuclease n=1 Tax=Amphritea opalescens TaxID=2490544 RepID=A0A430KRK4_9GAMM|nr:HNH endonuclease [Amphritea opalescens]RTE66106.1 HNH endonuclease [Amphritea opalescens]